MSLPAHPTVDHHPADCTCCTPADRLDALFWEHANVVAIRVIVGFVVALALMELHHFATGAGGVRVLLGGL